MRRVGASRRRRAYEAGRAGRLSGARPIPYAAPFDEFVLGESRLFERGVEPDLENRRAVLDLPGIATRLVPEEPSARADHRVAVSHELVGLGHDVDAEPLAAPVPFYVRLELARRDFEIADAGVVLARHRQYMKQLPALGSHFAAMASALTALPNVVRGGGRVYVGAGAGNYRGEQALALGLSARLDRESNIFVNVGAAIGADGEAVSRIVW